MRRSSSVIARLFIAVMIFIILYGGNYISFLFNKAHIEDLLAKGIELRMSDHILLGFGSFAWWAVIGCLLVGFIAAFVATRD